MREKKNTKKFRLPVNTGINPDGFAEDVPLMDSNNYVLSPDGSSLVPREGYEVRRKDVIAVSSDRKSIYFISNPPDMEDGGDLVVVINNKNGDLRIELTELVKAAGTGSSVTYIPSTFWIGGAAPDSIIPAFNYGTPYTEGGVEIYREPTESGTSFCRVWSQDIGDAVAGVDYTAFDTVLTFTGDEAMKLVTFPTDPTGQPTGKSFRVNIGGFSIGSGCPNDAGRYSTGEVWLSE